jgi:hypothetical protein
LAQARAGNSVRSVARLFTSDIEDKPWFNDREMWPAYFEMLARAHFNRFHLALGIGYDFLREVTDAYFVFAYPFFLSPAGHRVRATNLADAERDRNLETLQFITSQAAAHGLEFQLGLWTHGYQWVNSPVANHVIEGLTAENHAEYCRDALAELLRACPKITGVTFRIHGESGVAEGNYPFWKTVFDGVVRSGRRIEIDMHAKGIDQNMINVGLATKMPVKVSPKFWAEHMGLPYHQADIREQERPKAGKNDKGFFALSSGSRSFTRYGYADLLREDRKYGVVFRIWPGTQRLLLWSNPEMAQAYARAFQFCGSYGVDIMEPLSFKGRRGSGRGGGRCGYADKSLEPRWDWQKYASWYRVWGNALSGGAPEASKTDAEQALASASRILPLITTAHAPSAANNNYWPEMYTNQAIVDAKRKHQYSDMASPKVFGNVGGFDPQLFMSAIECADDLVKGERSAKYSPLEVANWLDESAAGAEKNLSPEFRRLAIDVKIQVGIGRFFAAKIRSAVLYAIHERSGDRAALEEALKQYRSAREAWAQLSEVAKGVYVADVTVGEHPWLRGHWLDRLPAIDADIADMAAKLAAAPAANGNAAKTIAQVLSKPGPLEMACRHRPRASFTPKLALALEIEPVKKIASARLQYRHVSQAERWNAVDMTARGAGFHAEIPASYTDSPYPLQYYFELRESAERVSLFPGLGRDLLRQPYFIIRQ